VYEHKFGESNGFFGRYKLSKLVYYERFASMRDAIDREKQLKGWLRARKVNLIEQENPFWLDLAKDWYARDPSQAQDDGDSHSNHHT
jgi:putative endonuclease